MWISLVIGVFLVLVILGWKVCLLAIAALVGAGFWAAQNLARVIQEDAPFGTKTIALQMVPELLREASLPWQKPEGLGGSLASLGTTAARTALDGSPRFRQAWFACKLLGPFCFPALVVMVNQPPKK